MTIKLILLLELLFLLHLLLNSLGITAPPATHWLSLFLILLGIEISLSCVFRSGAYIGLAAYRTDAKVIHNITLAITAFR